MFVMCKQSVSTAWSDNKGACGPAKATPEMGLLAGAFHNMHWHPWGCMGSQDVHGARAACCPSTTTKSVWVAHCPPEPERVEVPTSASSQTRGRAASAKSVSASKRRLCDKLEQNAYGMPDTI